MVGRITIAVAVAVALSMAAAWAQSGGGTDSKATEKAKPATTQVQAGIVASGGLDYVIGADDTLHISVWKEQELTENLPVRPDGKISMPLLGDVQAAGLTPTQLSEGIAERLKKYIADPRVTVIVTDMRSRRIYVLGEVQHTGPMPLLPDMTVLQALASAGFTQYANTKGIYILRAEKGKQQKISVPYKQLLRGEDISQNITLKPGDTIVVP